ncbi:ice-binding family protein [Glacieibacterium frigidum]|uniref:DUF3494 domain-containing protein n=1 Tax=Glacieibacterium frigidum TaxID=2593303 RepID=A0A552UJA4_9SPHN|nr:ice-binding family protein [Glacieibacterium frigidum]TRW18302.1 DUF3494 domain-containing protein [Glacieibacterium frigidum]
MTISGLHGPLFAILAMLPVPSAAAILLGSDLQGLSVFSNTAITAGAGARVYGSLMAGDVATAGAGSSVHGHYTSGGASVIGADGVTIGGNVNAGGAVTVGEATTIHGDVTTGAAATLGAGATINGDVNAAAAVTVGAASAVAGSVRAGAAATIGADATVAGTVGAVAAITQGAGSQVGGMHALASPPVESAAYAAALADRVGVIRTQVVAAQTGFAAMVATGALTPLMTSDTTLLSGVYSASSLSTTAGTTLTLDGQGRVGQVWVFNIADSLTTGANTNIVLIGGATANSIIWNTGSYASLGADSRLLGTLLSGGYISIGANTQVTGVGGTCGGAFSAASYVTAAAGATVGAEGCSGIDRGSASPPASPRLLPDGNAVPEPSTWALLLAGFAMVGRAMRRAGMRQVTA